MKSYMVRVPLGPVPVPNVVMVFCFTAGGIGVVNALICPRPTLVSVADTATAKVGSVMSVMFLTCPKLRDHAVAAAACSGGIIILSSM